MPITRAVIQLKALEITKDLNIPPTEFKAKIRLSIVNGFKKCCISNAMDGSEDDVLWEEAEPGDAQPEKVSDESDDSESGPSDAEDAAQ
ncbi:hypothetical protein AAFF_G00189790 [Aldrovandia affinis]|uniref:Uncharacterized protein n=1 Tax=Aldrovandia affinis TaxID=143900 RepID=A0AAD7RJ94_9TELE|nr:hypothetical protein AAFF_G00189790 [Aldrovandia affinis]